MKASWDESMETGYPAIDRQHRAIIDLIDDLQDVEHIDGLPQIRDVLVRVVDFTLAHFTMEEDLMRRVHYPADLELEMVRQHQEFTDYARLRVLEFSSSGGDNVQPLGAFIREWLVDHEFGLDRKLVAWIREKEAAGDRA